MEVISVDKVFASTISSGFAKAAALFADNYERERTVCTDSRKPQTCWNIHRFVHHIEWDFEDKDSENFSDGSGDKDCWVSPEYFIDMKKF